VLPARLAWLRPLLSLYIRRSQVGEMRDLAALVHAREGVAPADQPV